MSDMEGVFLKFTCQVMVRGYNLNIGRKWSLSDFK